LTKIISVHSFRGGTGKSNITANLSAILATQGQRVGVVDTDVQSPGIHVLFGLKGDSIDHALNDYLWGKCSIQETAHPVLKGEVPGEVYLIPSSVKANEIVHLLREGYEMRMLTSAFHSLSDELKLDYLLIDTHPGLNEETLFAIAISNSLAIVMRPDQQDYEGTGVTIEVARSLDVPKLIIVVNKTPQSFDPAAIEKRVVDAYGAEVGAVLPHSEEMMTLASNGIFALRYPSHPLTASLKKIAADLSA
jgi:MinD-like ATPase involved in chromosome partitioning or flagellar assembly